MTLAERIVRDLAQSHPPEWLVVLVLNKAEAAGFDLQREVPAYYHD